MKYSIACALALGMFLSGCSSTPAEPRQVVAPAPSTTEPAGREARSDDVRELLGAALHDALSAPTSLTAWRILPSHGGGVAEDHPSIDGYPIITGPVRIDDAARAQELLRIATDPRAFRDLGQRLRHPGAPAPAGCAFKPGVLLRATRGETTCQVLICFGCSEWRFSQVGASSSISDHFLGLHADIKHLAHALFPADKAFAP